MRDDITAAVPKWKCTILIADGTQQWSQILQPVGDDVDHLAFTLHLAVAGDHPS